VLSYEEFVEGKWVKRTNSAYRIKRDYQTFKSLHGYFIDHKINILLLKSSTYYEELLNYHNELYEHFFEIFQPFFISTNKNRRRHVDGGYNLSLYYEMLFRLFLDDPNKAHEIVRTAIALHATKKNVKSLDISFMEDAGSFVGALNSALNTHWMIEDINRIEQEGGRVAKKQGGL